MARKKIRHCTECNIKIEYGLECRFCHANICATGKCTESHKAKCKQRQESK